MLNQSSHNDSFSAKGGSNSSPLRRDFLKINKSEAKEKPETIFNQSLKRSTNNSFQKFVKNFENFEHFGNSSFDLNLNLNLKDLSLDQSLSMQLSIEKENSNNKKIVKLCDIIVKNGKELSKLVEAEKSKLEENKKSLNNFQILIDSLNEEMKIKQELFNEINNERTQNNDDCLKLENNLKKLEESLNSIQVGSRKIINDGPKELSFLLKKMRITEESYSNLCDMNKKEEIRLNKEVLEKQSSIYIMDLNINQNVERIKKAKSDSIKLISNLQKSIKFISTYEI